MEVGKNSFIVRKSYEIAYALWRVAAVIEQQDLREAIERNAVALLEVAVTGDHGAILDIVSGLEMMVRFGVDAGSIGLGNGQIINQEMGNLRAGLPKKEVSVLPKEVDLSNIFFETLDPGLSFDETEINIGDFYPAQDRSPAEEMSTPANIMKAEMRQSAIVEKIRQSGNCRLSDIQAILPDVSERTIRYDLESLVDRKILERVGTGGRSVFYRML